MAVIDRIIGQATLGSARRQLQRFMQLTREGRDQQEAFLRAHLQRCADSRFGRDHEFSRIADYRDFKAAVPIRQYDDFEPYIERLKTGEHDSLLGPSERLLMLAKTSGTTGAAKYIPVTKRFAAGYRYGWNVFGLRSILDHTGSLFGKIIQVTASDEEEVTEGGIPCGAISGLLARTQKWVVRRHYPAPLSVGRLTESVSKYYTILRCAAGQRIGCVVTANPATLLGIFRLAEERAEDLIRDIRDGGVGRNVAIPAELRADVSRRCPPDIQLARRLGRSLERSGRLLPRDYWSPVWIGCWIGGTMGLYVERLREYIGDTPIRDIGLLASEGRMTVPLHDGRPEGVLEISQGFYEFIPESQYGGDDPDVLRPDELEVGKAYYILLTNHTGLCRYDIGDRVRVQEFLGPTPVLEFLSKGAHFSSLTGEKLTEHQAVAAVGKLNKDLGLEIDNFVLAPHWGDPPNYVFHIEAASARGADADAIAARLDQMLMESNIEYVSKRKSDRLGLPTLNLVPDGFFERMDARLIVERSGRAEQYKHRYLYSTPGEDESLFSAACGEPPAQPAERDRVGRPIESGGQ
jgi:hypothetical protein